MGDTITSVLRTQDYTNMKRRVGISLAILIMFAVLYSAFYLFYFPKECIDTENSECFYDSLQKCSRVTWIREATQGDWKYTVLGKGEGEACKVTVELKSVSEGSVDAEALIDTKMTCNVQKNIQDYPEKDMDKCTGQLKEELQELVIQRMHKYLLENIGEIKQEFNEF